MNIKTELSEGHFEQIRNWEIEQWGQDLTTPKENIISSCGAFLENKLIGCALLVRSDLPTRLEITPWLASVYVEPEYRNSHIATSLVAKIIELSENLGFNEIYCFTYHSHTIYTRLGFKFIESSAYKGRPLTILKKKLPF